MKKLVLGIALCTVSFLVFFAFKNNAERPNTVKETAVESTDARGGGNSSPTNSGNNTMHPPEPSGKTAENSNTVGVLFDMDVKQKQFRVKYQCGKLQRLRAFVTNEHAKKKFDAQMVNCSPLDLSSTSIYDDLFFLASRGNIEMMQLFVTAPPLADPDPQIEAVLSRRYANEAPVILSRGSSLKDPTLMRLSAEYFAGCRIHLAGMGVLGLNRSYRLDPPAALVLLRSARELSGPAQDPKYQEFERRLQAASDLGGIGEFCPPPV